ncbi:conserved hypothetical protein [Gloeothece citriformis PCC 7424]|uniref:Uncharacterized protein n=1 Tax=Gloeothece citriformis (strain PCC 7424) TaxID=65393 RepID=B7KHB8_GLOC7|nr:hypothetical protein [Gloeothece citriformis]ACK69327.1 conserved hypothetical protein [Gloeothece citriformis PCC 7424]
MMLTLVDKLGEFNPQLFREIKGRLKPRNIAIATAISLTGQLLVYLYYSSLLPTIHTKYNRYCTGTDPSYNDHYYSYRQGLCIKDLQGNVMTLKELWGLDVFTCLSVVGIFTLLVVGTYMLISDLSKEEQRGTLNFIRLSPQTAKTIFIGKVLGVPILLYWVALLAVPFHLVMGLSAGIPLSLILAFYGVLIASCILFYNAALLFGLVGGGLNGFQAWLGGGTVLLFLSFMTGMVMSDSFLSESPFDWLTLFYPGTILPYLVDSTFLPHRTVHYLNLNHLNDLLWYGHPLWDKTWSGIGFILLNLGWWSYWITQALKRRFHNPLSTVLSKLQSYWITASFVIILLGFVLQDLNSYKLFQNFIVLQLFVVAFFLVLIAALSPHRQSLQDWARYRHQMGRDHQSLINDLILGEKSPSTVAIVLNLGIIAAYVTPAIVLSPLQEKMIPALTGLTLGLSMILIYALVAQRLLLMKSSKRFIASASVVGSLIVVPIISFGFLGIQESSWPWLFSVLPIVATESVTTTTILFSLLGQWLAISVLGIQMQKQLRLVGESQTKALLANNF